MREKELRLALVCYGGVSLAVYMHGVTKEIQKLARASKVYHAAPDPADRASLDYASAADSADRETDSEVAYYDMLQTIGRKLDLRVIVDVIAGASAGGINGIFLGRALAHDLTLDAHRDMWLRFADVTRLMEPRNMPGRFSKFYLLPLIWGFTKRRLKRFAPNPEVREKVLMMLRARWFRPPFSGRRFSAMMLEAFAAMGGGSGSGSLLPAGHKLDLYVSVTDFFGYRQTIALHDPPVIEEREHRHILRLQYLRDSDGRAVTDFDDRNLPGLAFAARATSSFPGAFPPARLAEFDSLLRDQGHDWLGRADFIERNFMPYAAAGDDPAATSFIDGSVLNNKPFAEAIRALQGRHAHRQVDRRIVYIDPNPYRGNQPVSMRPPGFLRTLRGALSDIPRNEPIRDDLDWANALSEQVRRLKQVVDAVRPEISELVYSLIDADLMTAPNIATLAQWRNTLNNVAAERAGYAYDSYLQLKVMSVLDDLCALIHGIDVGHSGGTQPADLTRRLEAWAHETGVFPARRAEPGSEPSEAPAWLDYLRRFDVGFRLRRLHFVIRRLNELYQSPPAGAEAEADIACLDEFKTVLYGVRDRLLRCVEPDNYGEGLRQQAKAFGAGGEAGALGTFVGELGDAMDLVALDQAADEIFSVMALNYLPDAMRRELLLAYLGFPFFDVLTLPITRWRDLDELDEIKVDRISPDDSQAIRKGGAEATLKGIELGHFGAFFSRRYRENDYLWGRLHGADRLVDIVAGAAGAAMGEAEQTSIKQALFRSILRAEAKHLRRIPDVIVDVGREIDAMAPVRRSDLPPTRQ